MPGEGYGGKVDLDLTPHALFGALIVGVVQSCLHLRSKLLPVSFSHLPVQRAGMVQTHAKCSLAPVVCQAKLLGKVSPRKSGKEFRANQSTQPI